MAKRRERPLVMPARTIILVGNRPLESLTPEERTSLGRAIFRSTVPALVSYADLEWARMTEEERKSAAG